MVKKIIGIDWNDDIKALNVADKHLKVGRWLSWGHLLNIGVSLDESRSLMNSKFFQKIRLFIRMNKFSKKQLRAILIRDNFKESFADDLVKNFNYYDFDSIMLFVNKIYEIKKAKNTSIEYYINRGYSIEESKSLNKSFKKRGANSATEKRKNNKDYDIWWRGTRSAGGIAAAKSFNRKINKSKFELKIEKALRILKIKNEKFFTPCNDDRLAIKSNFIHDFFLKDFNLIIEYNGSHWHHDIIHSKDKNKYCINDYIKTIIRAKVTLNYPRKKKIRYLILWEHDIQNNIRLALEKIMEAIKSEERFISTRKIDSIIFNHVI